MHFCGIPSTFSATDTRRLLYCETWMAGGGGERGGRLACRPWEDGTDSPDMAKVRVDAAFEFFEKLGP